MANLRFDIYRGEQIASSERPTQLPIKVGKLPTNQLRLDDPSVARMHAVIEQGADGSYQVVDLGTPQGTQVNGVPVQERQTIQSGDQLKFGAVTVVVHMEGAAAQPGAAASAGGFGGPSAASAGGFGGPPPGGGGFGDAPARAGGPSFGAPPPGANGAVSWGAPPAPAGQVHGQPQPDQAQVAAQKARVAAARAARRKRQQAREFERRFLSERYSGGKGALEVAMLWRGNLLQIDQYDESRKEPVTLGPGENEQGKKVVAPGVTYKLDVEGLAKKHEFLVRQGDRWQLNLDPGAMSGFLLVDPNRNKGEQKVRLEDAASVGVAQAQGSTLAVAIDGETRARIEIGDVTFLIHYVSLPVLKLVGGMRMTKIGLQAWTGSVVFFALLIGLVAYTPEPLDFNYQEQISEFVTAALQPEEEEPEEEEPEEEPEEEEPEEIPEEVEDSPPAGLERAAGQEGQAGQPDISTAGRMSVRGSGGELSLAQRNEVENSGLLTASTQMAALQGLGAIASGGDAMNAYGAFDGSLAPGGGPGNFGLGTSGSGSGGGGDAMGAFGGGGVGGDALGKGDDTTGSNRGSNVSRRATREPELRPARADINGALDPAIIRRVVRQHQNEILNCYQRELMKDPDLKGKIEVTWIIDGTGNVMSVDIKSNSMGNNTVAGCIKGRVARWRFPKPSNGGKVKVTYPFNFDSK